MIRHALALLLLPLVAGCATIRVTDPQRTATEQFLMSQAVSRALQQLNVDALRDRRVWVETGYFTGAEKVNVNGEERQRLFTTAEQAFATGELRERLLLAGAPPVPGGQEGRGVPEIPQGGLGGGPPGNTRGEPG